MREPFKNYHLFNKKQVKEFHAQLKKQFGFTGKLDYLFFEKKDKIYIQTKDIAKINLEKLNLNNLGLYIAKKEQNGLRLSIEGAQLIGPKATKNILEVNDPKPWLLGQDIDAINPLKSFVIIKYKKDFLGSGNYKDKKILNYIPKARRMR